jgi:uncharacterized protein (DUF1778 family)
LADAPLPGFARPSANAYFEHAARHPPRDSVSETVVALRLPEPVLGAKMAPYWEDDVSAGITSRMTAKAALRATGRARVTARVPKNIQARLEEAADLVGATVNQFVLQAALKEADQIIERERVIRLSKRDAMRMLELLDKPPRPNAKLRRALERRERFLSGRPHRTAD